MSEAAESYPTIRDFVFQDAQEKAFETHLRGIKEYEIEKRDIYEQRMDQVIEQAERKLKEQEVEKRIYKSSLINHSRMEKMILRNDLITHIVSVAQSSIFDMIVKDKPKYKDLLKKLIIQSLIDLFQQKVSVRCLQRDAGLVKEVIPECKRDYEALLNKELGLTVNLQLSLNDTQYLQERDISQSQAPTLASVSSAKGNKTTGQQLIRKSVQDSKCFGGVLLSTEDKLITSKNTLDARINLAYGTLLPQIRVNLFD